jgi:hypothetical protein
VGAGWVFVSLVWGCLMNWVGDGWLVVDGYGLGGVEGWSVPGTGGVVCREMAWLEVLWLSVCMRLMQSDQPINWFNGRDETRRDGQAGR